MPPSSLSSFLFSLFIVAHPTNIRGCGMNFCKWYKKPPLGRGVGGDRSGMQVRIAYGKIAQYLNQKLRTFQSLALQYLLLGN